MKTNLDEQICVDVKCKINYTTHINGNGTTQPSEEAFVEIVNVFLGDLDITDQLFKQHFDFKLLEEKLLEAYETQVYEGFGND